MQCKGCCEEYDQEMYPVCPYCLRPSENNDNALRVITGNINTKQNEENIISQDRIKKNDLTPRIIIEAPEVDYTALNNDFNIYSEEGAVNKEELPLLGAENNARNIEAESIIGISLLSDGVSSLTASLNSGDPQNDCGKSRVTVSQAFSENKFTLFVNYCNDHGLEFVDQLGGIDFSELNSVKGIGARKINDIRKKLDYLKIGDFEGSPVSDITTENYHPSDSKRFCAINEQLMEQDLSLLFNLGMDNKLIKALNHSGIKKIGDLLGISQIKISAVVGEKNFDKFLEFEKLLEYSLVELLESFLKELSETDEFQLVLFRAAGFTLREIGDLRGVSRERARQIINNFSRKLDPFMKGIMHFFMGKKGYVAVQELADIYENDDFDKILIYWCKNMNQIKYLDFADIFLPESTNINAIKKELLLFSEEFIGDGINLYNKLEELDAVMKAKNLPYINISAFMDFLVNNGYRIYGDFAVKGRVSYGYLCAKAVAQYFPNGIKLSDSFELDQLRKFVLQDYGDIGVSDDDRALGARLSEFTVLCGRGTVTAEENINVEMNLLEEIKDFIDLSQEAEIYYSEIYAKFQGPISMMSNIDNHYFLHGVLKLYYSEEYEFSNRDFLSKSGVGLVSGKISDKLRKFFAEKGCPVNKKAIKRKFPGMTDSVLNNAVASDPHFFQWEFNEFYTIELLIVTDDDKRYLRNKIKTIMDKNNGYCSDNLLFEEVNQERFSFLRKNSIKTPNTLFFLCAKLFEDVYEFRRPHIGKPGLLESITVKNIALHLLGHPDLFYFSEYQNIAKALKWSDATTGIVFGDIEKEYIRVSSNLYIKRDKFEIDDWFISKVEVILRGRMDQGFVSLINFSFWDDLPVCKYEWNVYFLRSLIDKYMPALKVIEIRTKDRRYERGIVLDVNSPIKNYEDLIITFLNVNGVSETTENHMTSILVMHNLTYKMIPKELYSSEKLKYKNETFFIPDV